MSVTTMLPRTAVQRREPGWLTRLFDYKPFLIVVCLMPAVGLEVSALGAARAYEGLLLGWVIDERDRELAPTIEELGVRTAVTDTVMTSDAVAKALGRTALELVAG